MSFQPTAGMFGAPNLLALVPLQGSPFQASTEYAAVVTTAVKDVSGAALTASPAIATIASGKAPSGMRAAALPVYSAAIAAAALAKAGVAGNGDRRAGRLHHRGSPGADGTSSRQDVLSRPLPAPDSPFVRTDLFDDYCAYESTIAMPDYQSGIPPFSSTGGAWEVDTSGNPVLQRNEEARIFVTVPRAPIPRRWLSHRPVHTNRRRRRQAAHRSRDAGDQRGPGARTSTGARALLLRARRLRRDQLRRPAGRIITTTNANEASRIFNVFNPSAPPRQCRAQSALEIMLQAHILPTISFDVSDCPGATAQHGGHPGDVRPPRSPRADGSLDGLGNAPLAAAHWSRRSGHRAPAAQGRAG